MMKKETHIIAVRKGIKKRIPIRLWEKGIHEKHGWEKLGDVKAIEKIKTETVEVVEVVPPNEEPKEEPKGEKVYPTKEQIWAYLKQLKEDGKIEKLPHHLTGEDKLRKIYDDYEDTE